MTDIFEEPKVTPKLEDYVGEGKKYADNDAAAKAIAEKDAFINRLLQEARQKEEALQQAINTKAFEDRIKALEEAKLAQREEPLQREATPPVAPQIDEEAIARVMAKREAENNRTRNLMSVQEKLTEVWGENYPSRVKARAAELNVPMEEVNRLAATSPSALFALLGATPQRPAGDVAPPPSRQNTAAFAPDVAVRGNKYYTELRKTKPAEYFSPRIAAEEYNALKTLGPEKFYAS
jgi:hypothetical protein